MKDEAGRWLRVSREDYDIAKYLYDTYYPKPLEIICYHCQQSAEKSIKALIIALNLPGGLPKKHERLYPWDIKGDCVPSHKGFAHSCFVINRQKKPNYYEKVF